VGGSERSYGGDVGEGRDYVATMGVTIPMSMHCAKRTKTLFCSDSCAVSLKY